MGNSVQNTGTVTEKIIEKSHTRLKDDDMPVLKVNLDGNSKSIENLKDIEVKTVNGKDLDKLFSDLSAAVKSEAKASYAPKGHDHKEFDEIAERISELEATKQEAGSYASEKHSHAITDTTGLLPLKRIEKGVELGLLASQNVEVKGHKHLDLERAIQRVQQNVDELAKKPCAAGDVGVQLQKELKSVEDHFNAEILAVKQSVPKIKDEIQEAGGVGFILVFSKYNGKTIGEISGRGTDGSPVSVSIERSGKEVKVGDIVQTDDVLTLTPRNALVRIRFI